MADETLSIIFNVEDGTCVSGANSYISLEEADQYQTNKNRTDWLALSDDEKKSWIIKGTQYIDKLYTWKGQRLWEQQVLSFPRCRRIQGQSYPLIDLDGFQIKGVPRQIKEAVCEAAFYGYQAGEELFTVYENETSKLKREKKVVSGAVEKELEWFDDTESVTEYISKYTSLDSILRGLYVEKGESNNSVNCRAVWDY